MKILDIEAIQILDSRGNPTLQVSVLLLDGSKGVFMVPSGASTGIHEALELRDKDESLFHGKSVFNAIKNIEEITKDLIDIEFDQKSLDNKLLEIDGSDNKSVLGANAILGISVAFAKASAKFYSLSLYDYLYRLINDISFESKNEMKLTHNVVPFANIINGGLHSGNSLQIQEFMIIPFLNSVSDNVRAISEIYQTLKVLIEKQYGKSNTAVGDEGGFAPEIASATEALDLINQAVINSNYEGKVFFAMDAAASDFYDSKTKKYEVELGKKLDYKKLTDYYNDLIKKYPLISIEDAMSEDDFEGFKYFMKNRFDLPFVNPLTNTKKVMSVGDDLLVTNPLRIKMSQKEKLCDSLLLKINQIGTLTESIEAFKLAKQANWQVIVSHRSGETTDDFISDLSVAMECSIKLGAPARGERVAKYNRLLNIYN